MLPSSFVRLIAVCAAAVIAGACSDAGERQAVNVNETAWPMHPIDSRFRGSNALGPGDVDGDGQIDYVTNYEFDQRYVIEFHPPRGEDPRRPWPTVVAYELTGGGQGADGVDTESASLADLDGDGNLDVVGAQGSHITTFFEGDAPGIRVLWGPPAASARDPGAWTDAGRFPETVDRGHFLWTVPHDVNGDGALDLLYGGRVLWKNDAKGSVKWLEAPRDPALRRDLAQWHAHDIDPEQLDGHGFVLTDVDEDGDDDVLDVNADFDTPPEAITVHWYENPGPGTEAQKGRWPKHVIASDPAFYFKPQIAVGDLDGDGHQDFVTAVEDALYWYRKTGVSPVTFERVVIPKDPVARQLTRPVRLADVSGDGRLDVFGMTLHDDGVLPAERAGAFWMEFTGDAPGPDNWITHVIKWGSGKPMSFSAFGEKWDQAELSDLDGDGDLDVIANCEEWWADTIEVLPWWDPRRDPQSVAVVWFENRIREAPYAFAERDGRVAIEAEHHTDWRDATWVIFGRHDGFAGEGYVQDFNSTSGAARAFDDTRGLEYAVDLDGGAYFVWLRRWVPSSWGRVDSGLGGAGSDSTWVGLDGVSAWGVVDGRAAYFDAWTWVRSEEAVELTAGRHVVNLRTRSGGYAVDRIVLTRDAAFPPDGVGPDETAAESAR